MLARLAAADAPLVLALSSEEALQRVLPQLPDALATRLRHAPVVAASARLATVARDLGWQRVLVAGSPRPAALARTAADALPTNA